MMSLVRTLTAVLFCEFDPAAFNFIDRPDVHTVRADDFHMLFDVH